MVSKMSLQALLRCSDVDFERMIGDMDQRGVIGVMNEIISEMDKEQSSFDSLSAQIDVIKDQASAEFKDISTELIKSQNRLALLMSRNMFCFNLQNQEQVKPKAEPIVTKQARPVANKPKDSPTQENGDAKPTTKKKVVKVTRVIRRKVISDSEELDPQLKSIMDSRRNQIKNYSKEKSEQTAASSTPNNTPVKSSLTVSKPAGSTSPVIIAKPGSAASKVTATASVQLTRDRSGSAPKRATVAKLRSDSNSSNGSSVCKSNGHASSPIPSSNIDEVASSENDGNSPRISADVTRTGGADVTRIGGALSSSPRLINDSAASSDTDTSQTSSSVTTDLAFDFNSMDFESEKVKERVFMKTWNPVKLLKELYSLNLAKERATLTTSEVINMEGYVEQLPVGKKKTTLLKTWKRIYCKVKEGSMYFSRSKDDKVISHLSIMGGVLEDMSHGMIGIDDRRGHYLMMRCPNDAEYRDWLRSLYTQIKCSPAINYIRPTLTANTPHQNKVVIVDLGSTSIRAGILGNMPSYPQLFFPCVTNTDTSGKRIFGLECFHPDNRVRGLHHPVASTKHIDKYRVNAQVLQDMFSYIFDQLNARPAEYSVMLATPHKFSAKLQEEVLNVLLTRLQVKAANLINQSLLTPYIYNATSGIVVDIGERIEIVAITDGYLVEGGTSRRLYGGTRITDNLNSALMEYRLFTPVEHLITRLIKEKTCYISQDYEDDLLECMSDNSLCQATVDLEQFDLPEGAHLKLITVDSARFKAPEGLLRAELLGVDSPDLPHLIQQTVSKCPMDLRREMWQSIYLSGGTTLIEGFSERLETELKQIAPPSVDVQVHSSPHRYHAAYIGACALAKLPNFTQSCITKEEWVRQGRATLSKWKYQFQS